MNANPPSLRQLVAVWVGVVGLLGGLLWLAQLSRSPLDDPDPARQRPGFLDAVGRPTPAPVVVGDQPHLGQRAVVFFVRPEVAGPLCRAVGDHDRLRRRADLIVVVSGPGPDCPTAPTVVDSSGALLAAFGLRTPIDGGPAVGYAIVDRAGRIRYRTLDASVTNGFDEVETMVKATP